MAPSPPGVTIPTAVLDFDFARPVGLAGAVPPRFRRARVLARWAGVPVGVVEVSVRSGRVRRDDVLQALQAQDPAALPREAVRRALLQTGVRPGGDLAAAGLRAEAPPPAALPRVSVIVCTRDRPEELAACLAALTDLTPRPLEVIVVDNAPSSDATLQLVHDRYPEFRYVFEERPGLDHARNRGLAEAAGDVLAFTDDDVIVDPGWVGALARAFAADPAVGLVTGLAEPAALETRAQLLFERYGGFGRGCRRTCSQVPQPGRIPWNLVGAGQLGAGANMAFRREVFGSVGAFDPALDVGTPTLGGGDHDMFFRVLHAGWLCVYEPAAVVRHRHRRTMAELRWLLFSYGHATRCFLDREERNFPADRPAVRRLRRWWWRHWALARWWRAWYRPAWIPLPLVVAEIKGYLAARGAYRRARAAIVADESARPDAARSLAPRPAPRAPGAISLASVEVSEPLRALEETAGYASVRVTVLWHGCPLGSLHLANAGQPVSAQRLADEIAQALWPRLLDPASPEPAAIARFAAGFARSMPVPDGIPAEPATLPATIVVTTCRRPVELRRCLQSLALLCTSRPVQIVVVDNRPDTAAAAEVVREFPGVELVREPRAGSSYARNAGIAAARGEFIAMVDDDMRVAPDWLERLLAPFARADVMAVTGNTLAARLETRAEQMLDLYGGFSRGCQARDFDRHWFHRRRWRAVPTWQIGGSGNAAFRRDIFSWREIGGFAVTLGAGVPTGVGEDTKLFYDLLAADFTIVYEPGAVAWHHHRVTMAALRSQLFGYSKGHVAYHLLTLFEHGDLRALVRIFVELPVAFAQRARDRLRHRSAYAWSLLLVEFAGTLAGPWALWRAHRLARRVARQTRQTPAPRRDSSGSARRRAVLEAHP